MAGRDSLDFVRHDSGLPAAGSIRTANAASPAYRSRVDVRRLDPTQSPASRCPVPALAPTEIKKSASTSIGGAG